MALYGGEKDDGFYVKDEDSTSEEYDLEYGDEGKGVKGVRSSLSLEIYGLQREQHVYFSNQEYYKRLEELKIAHLRNMAELERMYISQERNREENDGRGEDRETRLSVSGPARKLQRINSQEELDFHDTSSGSDQSELYRAESEGDLELDTARMTEQEQSFGREFLMCPEYMTSQKKYQFQPTHYRKLQGMPSRQTGVRVRSNSKVTVPKPFQMMLREEERKKHKVRTRSEIELENTLLRRELEELQECQKKFRASPAPAHIHLPLYEISRRSSQRSSQSRNISSNSKRNQGSSNSLSQPFHFLERERRKREAKIMAELGNHGKKEERRVFKARPMPRSVYGTGHKAVSCQPKFLSICTLERETTEGQSEPNSDLEADASNDPCRPQTCTFSRSNSRSR